MATDEMREDSIHTITEPGRTAGQAEGERDDEGSYDPAYEPGRTAGQAEGEREPMEERERMETESTARTQQTHGQSSEQTGEQPLRQEMGKSVRGQQQQQATSWEEIMRWGALMGGSWLLFYGLSRSLGSLSLMAIGSGLVYYHSTVHGLRSHNGGGAAVTVRALDR